ncbi:MAG: hypothetical protein CL911_04990 [Deltaproteobacteria bacterium]|nr:hypothetical protein [Deltaproteobacteria bacterium]
MIPLLNLQAASKHLNCSPSTLVQRGAQGELQVFALFENATGIAGLEDLPKFEEKLQELYDKGTGVFRPARAHFKGLLPPSRPSDCFRVPKGALEELATGAESVELPSAIIESHHKLTDPDPGTAWFVDFEHPHPSITLESLRFREADLEPKVGSKPDERTKPRTPLTAFITSELFKGIQDWHKSWDTLWKLADGKTWQDIGDFSWKLTRSRKDTTKTENVPAIEMEGDIRWKRTVPKEDFGRIFRRIQKMRTQADSPK